MVNTAVIGSSSMVASRFCDLATDLDLIKGDLAGENPIDITDPLSVDNFFKINNFDWAILFSAFTDVDKAEEQKNDESGLCWNLNVKGAKNIVEACKKNNKKLILISTDFVFDGESGPYKEIEAQNQNLDKIGWYGYTKFLSEQSALTLEHCIILRITYPYRADFEQKTDFARNILKKFEEKTLYPLFSDQKTTPTFADDLAPAIKLLITENQKGIFHVASPKLVSPLEFGQKLVEKFFNSNEKLKAALLKEFLSEPNATPRPLSGGLSTEKIQKLGFVPTNWEAGIEKLYDQKTKN